MLHSRMRLFDLIDLYHKWIDENGKSMGSSAFSGLKKALTQFRGDG